MNDIKKNEIKYLEKKYNINISKTFSLEEYSKIKRNLFVSELINKNLTVTNNHCKPNIINYNNKKISYSYSYLRFDSNIVYSNFAKDFYNIRFNIKEKTFFTNCGMSAISALFLSLQKVIKNLEIVFLDRDIYFETYDFYNKYILMKDLNEESNIKIIYLDSICKNFNFKNYEEIILGKNKPFAIIFDTTCFDSKEIQSFINKLVSKNIFCIFVRSHTKLDMLATEVTSLGSLSFVIPTNIKLEKFKVIKEIISNFYYLLGKFGVLCTPDKFPEFIFDKDFKIINYHRISNLQKNNINLYNEIKDLKTGSSILPTHKKFVLFITNNSISSDEQRIIIENKIKRFVKNFDSINSACSFGFDYVAIDSYYDINEENYVIRISMNDDYKNKINLKLIKEFLNDSF